MNNIKNLFNNNAQNSILCIDNEIKMIKIKLLKYSKEEVINRVKLVYKEFENNLFIEKYINYNNYISYYFLKYFLIDEEKQENNDSYLEELIKIIKPKVDINKLTTDLLSFNNIKLLMIISSKEYLIDNLLKTYNFDINTKIFDIINTIFQKNDLSALKDIFVIVNNIKNEISSLVENITKLPLKYEENENCLNFMEYYIEKIIELIKDEVTYYIKPELMKSYFELINNQFLRGKVNYVIMKKLYYKMIELIVDKSIQINENDKNEDGKNYYGDSYKYIKENMEKLLINRKEIIKDIINKKENNKNKFQFLNWID
jgi:hypothetical protein